MSAIKSLPYSGQLLCEDELRADEVVTSDADPLRTVISAYLGAAGGDPTAALQLAVMDLMRSRDEVALAITALDQWTSRGYVRGRASERLTANVRALVPAPAGRRG